MIFTNSNVTKATDIIGTIENATVTGWTDPASAALSAGTTKGVVNIKSGGQIKYVGIPCGTSVEVYETNPVTGVTYQVTSTLTPDSTESPASTTDASVTWGTAPTTATAQADTKEAYQSTKVTFETEADKDDDNDYTIKITNTLVTISPTGVTLRIAPYAIMLAAGVCMLFFSRRRRTAYED